MSFNGAALRGARRAPSGPTSSRPWACFNGAALRGARRGRPRPRASPWRRGFNGAALRGARRGRDDPPARATAAWASTGPRSGERGELPRQWHPLRGGGGASTGPRSGERGEATGALLQASGQAASTGPRSGERGEPRWRCRSIGSCARFNGAALRGARRGDFVLPVWAHAAVLQRGRAPGSAER